MAQKKRLEGYSHSKPNKGRISSVSILVTKSELLPFCHSELSVVITTSTTLQRNSWQLCECVSVFVSVRG